MKILIVEDEIKLLETIKSALESEQYIIESAKNYSEAFHKIISFEYDCILLDIMLPDGNGLNLLKELKKMGKSENVLILSAKDSIEDKVKGLELGADDYLTKPFHIAELNARIKSILRRKTFGGRANISIANVEIDPENRTVLVKEAKIDLNRKEFDMLLYFVLNKNRLVSKTSLAERVWGDYIDEADDFEFIYSQVKNLRKKLKQSDADIIIESVYGIGYKLRLK